MAARMLVHVSCFMSISLGNVRAQLDGQAEGVVLQRGNRRDR